MKSPLRNVSGDRDQRPPSPAKKKKCTTDTGVVGHFPPVGNRTPFFLVIVICKEPLHHRPGLIGIRLNTAGMTMMMMMMMMMMIVMNDDQHLLEGFN